MRITPSNGNRPKAIGALLSDLTSGLAAGCTILVELNSAISPSGFLIFIGDDINFDVADEAIIANANGALFDYWDLDISDAISGSGLHKIAMTLARDVGGGDYEYAWCDDGGAAITQTVDYLTHVTAVDTILFGHDGVGSGNSLNDIYIRSITLYPAKLPAALTALTDLPDPLEISGTPVLTTEEDVAYAGFTVSATGGTAPYAYSVFSGSLPAGITLNGSTGAVTGTPTTPGISEDIVIRVTDDLGATDDLAAFDLEVTEAGSLTPMITDSAIYTPNADPMPDPFVPYTDDLLVPIMRWSGVPGTQIGSFTGKLYGDICRAQYPKHDFWNSNMALAYFEKNAGSGGYSGNIFVNGATGEPVYCWDRPGGWEEARWSEVEPDLMIAVIGDAICHYDVTDGTYDVTHDFNGTYSDMTIGLYEGELSWDSDIVPIQATRDSDGHEVCFAFKISTDTVLGVIDLDGIEITDGGVSISPLGNYIVRGNDDGTHDIHLIDGTHHLHFSEDEKPSHYSFAVEGGIEYMVGGDRSASGDLIKRRLSNGTTTVIGPDAFTYHTSARSHDIVTLWISTDYWPDSDNANDIYVSQIVIVAMDGSVVGRVCFTHKSGTIEYDRETHGIISPDGKMIAFQTDWGNGSGPVVTFVADMNNFSCAGLFP
ncbi:MAG: hypothetical protein EOR30_17100 [Mesorhizobium sp.]|nr:hypothetical protein EOA78_04755 [Mesorhizobium sp. M5C.F.Cr.IN.023.01.1.1]RWF80285.1 MAG: hypothetical protein EOQ36_32900 [Mesorhizobium sp.]RWF95413.1 MAG: hypothetical protein EOQ45_08165 [Mesorhizobium sp.]RWI40010.1 MAG: hypothetical protein EOR14_17485 [Mesorhizobium sp.]RWI45386.1 MAG: hypothetical protein EOR15_22555 [Mesorhizobium sp.]